MAADRACLEAILADRNVRQKHAARARIILASAAPLPVAEVARRAGIAEHNHDPKPFTRTTAPEHIFAKLNPRNASVH